MVGSMTTSGTWRPSPPSAPHRASCAPSSPRCRRSRRGRPSPTVATPPTPTATTADVPPTGCWRRCTLPVCAAQLPSGGWGRPRTPSAWPATGRHRRHCSPGAGRSSSRAGPGWPWSGRAPPPGPAARWRPPSAGGWPRPAASMHLRRAVAARGSLLSELPAGAVGAPWWFAVRNRLMAALAHVVVVVESHLGGGSMHTVRAARARRVPVAAVPGPLTSPSCAGTNLLLVQGAQAVRDADDVVDLALREVRGRPGIAEPTHRGGRLVPNGTRRTGTPGVDLPASEVARRVWPVLDERFASLEAVVARSGVAPADT